MLSQGEIQKTIFTFQTFVLNRWSIMSHDMIGGGYKAIKRGQHKRALQSVLGLAILGMGEFAEDQARGYVYRATTGRELPDRPAWQDATFGYIRNVPLAGPILEATMTGRASYGPPTARMGHQIAQGLKNSFTGKYKKTRVRGVIQGVEAGLSLFVGIPGTAQAGDLLERLYGEPSEREKRVVRRKSKIKARKKGRK
jgi:hypothetical protein